jgi:hypothetical protein
MFCAKTKLLKKYFGRNGSIKKTISLAETKAIRLYGRHPRPRQPVTTTAGHGASPLQRAKETKWSKYFSVEHCARQHEPKGVWLQCLACSELLPQQPLAPGRRPPEKEKAAAAQAERCPAPRQQRKGGAQPGDGGSARRRSRFIAQAAAPWPLRMRGCMLLLQQCVPGVLACGLCPVPLYVCTIPSSTTSSPAIVTGHVQSCDKKIAKPPGCMCGPSLQHLQAAVNLGAIPPPVGLFPSATFVALGACRGRRAELGVFDVGSPSQGLGFSTPKVPTDHILRKAHLPICFLLHFIKGGVFTTHKLRLRQTSGPNLRFRPSLYISNPRWPKYLCFQSAIANLFFFLGTLLPVLGLFGPLWA